MKNRTTNVLRYLGYISLIAVLLMGCAQKVRQPVSALDTPEHHVEMGARLLADGKYDDALREFDSALELAPRYSPAWRGKGLVLGYSGKEKDSLDAMAKAQRYGKTPGDEAEAYVGLIRLYTLFKGNQWLDRSQDAYEKALFAVRDMPQACYYMGMAYKDAGDYGAAIKQFTTVLEIKKGLISEADEQIKLVQRIQRALPGSGVGVGSELAGRTAITRADCAAIFIHELRIDEIYSRAKAIKKAQQAMPPDVQTHALAADIRQIIQMGVRGLESYPDGTFRPDKPVTRAAYAMMIEDIIGTVVHDESLSTRYIGQTSPFPDIASDAPYFNAIMVCSTRGIMGAEDILTGKFNPQGAVSGADALLIIRHLKEKIRMY